MNILTAIRRFAETGPDDVMKLQGSYSPEFRLRGGDYCVRFTEGDADNSEHSRCQESQRCLP